MAIGVPGWPEFACCTASMASVRMVLMQSRSRSDALVAAMFRSAAGGALGVTAELLAQRRQDLLGERLLCAGAEARVERGGEHVGRDVLVDRRLDRPSALTGVLHEACVRGELRIRAERDFQQIEEPGANDAGVPPDLRDRVQVDPVAVLRLYLLGA